MQNDLPLREYWEKEYSSPDTPFDIDEPDVWIAAMGEAGKARGDVLDAGCGPGRTPFYLASRGHRALGVDISANAAERARRKAAGPKHSPRLPAGPSSPWRNGRSSCSSPRTTGRRSASGSPRCASADRRML